MLKRLISNLANQFGYEITRLSSEQPQGFQSVELPFIDLLDLIVQDYRQQHPEMFFVQIGAHDGSSADPVSPLIRKYHWQGILVEPQPQSFKTLVENYRDEPQLMFENAVISDHDGTATFYTVRQGIPDMPFWLSQSASLSKDAVLGALYYWRNVKQLSTIPADLESMIEEVPLPALTVKSLLAKHQVERVDLLVIDTMGFDFEILKMFPFDLLKPAIIHFEHSFLAPAEQQACFQYLAKQGYSLARVAVDTIAYLHANTRHWTVSSW